MLKSFVALTIFSGAATVAPLSSAQAGVFGVQTLLSERTCSGAAANQDCPGGPRLRPFVTDGGLGQSHASGSFVDTVVRPQMGSFATAAAELDGGGLNLPTLHASSYAAPGNARVNGSASGFVSLTYNGAAASRFGLRANLRIDDSSDSPANPLRPGGSTAALYLAIYDEQAFRNNFIEDGDVNVLYGGTCGDAPGLLGWAYASVLGTGGAFNVHAATTACGNGPLMLQPGQSIVAYSNLSLFTNRGGLLDASHTLTTELDPTLGEAVIQNLQQNVTAGVPEPASWAMMVGGFGVIGSTLRSRRKAAVSFG